MAVLEMTPAVESSSRRVRAHHDDFVLLVAKPHRPQRRHKGTHGALLSLPSRRFDVQRNPAEVELLEQPDKHWKVQALKPSRPV